MIGDDFHRASYFLAQETAAFEPRLHARVAYVTVQRKTFRPIQANNLKVPEQRPMSQKRSRRTRAELRDVRLSAGPEVLLG